ncbi:MAG: hemerythrin domain-containing protein [Burkholderiaceae bacterium]|jgi:hemerythrin-like domain-containing protein|nr:hemerythrin domain-containing protein [Burkholderiales bacterium]MCZ8106238.1 hemerythrin domain-containing protein [Burkholderiales bacterium]MCZ8338852.1 hemerythrin domain-containing protein [Burkholderiaceae bacterium]
MNAAVESHAVSSAIADEAIASFSRSHVHIIDQMERLRVLPTQLAQRGLDEGVRAAAAGLYRFFNDSVLEHHDEEERDLFPALRHSAVPGDEAGLVDALVARLEREHRELEALWDRVEPGLRRLGRGKSATLDAEAMEALTARYVEHARFEEAAVLPLADRMLKAGDRAALSLGLAMRRNPYRAVGYI